MGEEVGVGVGVGTATLIKAIRFDQVADELAEV